MTPQADDYATIARRMAEIAAEEAAARAARDKREATDVEWYGNLAVEGAKSA
jgi:hypothetical protein